MAELHPRNLHRDGYDLEALCQAHPPLENFVIQGPRQKTIDFADPEGVKALNTALLRHHYKIQYWDIPPAYLCPAIPGRADYIHHLADLLSKGASKKIPEGKTIRILDIGTGANCIYPILGNRIYGWQFVGTEVDPKAVATANAIISFNKSITKNIEIRQQKDKGAIFKGVISETDRFAACMCNPPFHPSQAAALAATRRKVKGLKGKRVLQPQLNFGGQSTELVYPGGELAFIQQLIRESQVHPDLCRWFTTLVSQKKHLPALEKSLNRVKAAEIRIIAMAHGQKQSRILAWHF